MDLYGYYGGDGGESASDPYNFELTDEPPVPAAELPPKAASSKPARGLRSTSVKWGAALKGKPALTPGRARAGSLERDPPKRRASQSGDAGVLPNKTEFSFEAARANAKSKQGSVEERVAARLAQLERERESKLDESMLSMPKSEDDKRQLGASLVAMAQPISIPLVSTLAHLPISVFNDVELEQINANDEAHQTQQTVSTVEQASFASVANLLRQSADSTQLPSIPTSDFVDASQQQDQQSLLMDASASVDQPRHSPSLSFVQSVDVPWRSVQGSERLLGVRLLDSHHHPTAQSSQSGETYVVQAPPNVPLEAVAEQPQLAVQDLSTKQTLPQPDGLVNAAAVVASASSSTVPPSKHAVAQSALAMALRAAASSALSKALKARPQAEPPLRDMAAPPRTQPLMPPDVPVNSSSVHNLPAWQRFLQTEQLQPDTTVPSHIEAQNEKLSHMASALDAVTSLLRDTRAQTSCQLSELQQSLRDANERQSQAISMGDIPEEHNKTSFVASTSPMSPQAIQGTWAASDLSPHQVAPDDDIQSAMPSSNTQPPASGDWRRTLSLALWHLCVLKKAEDPSSWIRGPSSRLLETERVALLKDTFFDDLGSAVETIRRGNAKGFVPLEVVRGLETTTTMLHGMVAAYEADNVTLRKELLTLRQRKSVDIDLQSRPSPLVTLDLEPPISTTLPPPDMNLQRKFDCLLEEHRELQLKHAAATSDYRREKEKTTSLSTALKSLEEKFASKGVPTVPHVTSSPKQQLLSDTQTARELGALRAELSELRSAARATKTAYEALISSLREDSVNAAAKHTKELEKLSKELAKRQTSAPVARVKTATEAAKPTAMHGMRVTQLENDNASLRTQNIALQAALRKAKSAPIEKPADRPSGDMLLKKHRTPNPTELASVAPAKAPTAIQFASSSSALAQESRSAATVDRDMVLSASVSPIAAPSLPKAEQGVSELAALTVSVAKVAHGTTSNQHAAISHESSGAAGGQSADSKPALENMIQALQRRLEDRSIALARAEDVYQSSSALLESKISEKYETVLKQKDNALAAALVGLQQFAREISLLRGCQT